MAQILKIRRVEPSDVDAIYWLRRRTFEMINSRDYTPEQVKIATKVNTRQRILDKMQDRDSFCLILSEDSKNSREKLLGTVDLKGDRIGGLFVRWNYLMKGCGSALIDFIEKYAAERGIKKVTLHSTKYAAGFYIHKGYSPVIDRFTPTLEMEKTLA